ncbi:MULTISPECIES: putative quinol monooxygenase [unclassified Streptomyces]|uniref:putative quinol monooxygenase n=1 Tax=unclassified Streptomyces TaxID=2593676 RepID=UPI00380FCB78
MPELQVIARYTVSEGHEDEVFALLPALAEASRAEPGNISFEVFHALGDARDVVLLERYDSPRAFAAHRDSLHFKDLVLRRIAPLLVSRVVATYEAGE